MVKKKNLYFIICIILVLSFFVRFYNLQNPKTFVGIEKLYIDSALNYMNSGFFGPDNWYTPPLKKIVPFLSMKIFGNNSFAWRVPNALFGSLTPLILFLLFIEIKEKRVNDIKPMFTAAILLATDPLHIVFSRTHFEDIYAIFFYLCALLFFFKFLNKKNTYQILMSGIFFGIALSARWYIVIGLLVIVLILFKRFYNKQLTLIETASATVSLTMIPIIIYLWTFLPWFALRGYSISEWANYQLAMYRAEMSVTAKDYVYGKYYGNSIHASDWFSKIITFSYTVDLGKGYISRVLFVNNPLIWLMTLPSQIYILILLLKRYKFEWIFCIINFWIYYLILLITARPILIYTSFVLIPFSFISISMMIEHFSDKFRVKYLFDATIVFCLVQLAFLFPLLTSIPVKTTSFRILLDILKIS